MSPFVASSVALAQRSSRRVEVVNMRVGFDASMSTTLKSSNSFKIGTWTPVWVQLQGGSERFNGFMDLIAGDDDGTPTSFRIPVEVAANQAQSFTAYARPGSREPEFTVQLLDTDGRRVGGASQSMVTPLAPAAIMPDETLLLMLGRPQGVEMIPALPGFKGSTGGSSFNVRDEIVTARIDAQGGSLPGRWYGYDAARAVVVDTGDHATLAALGGLRGQPLVDWVARGGHLVIAVGANWQAVRDSALAPILPGLPSGQERVTSLEALDTFAGSTKQITPPRTPPVLVTRLEGIKERGGKVLSKTSNLPLVVRGPYGFGRVTLVALDVDQKPFANWPDRALFWVRAIDLRPPAADQTGAGSLVGGGGRAFNRVGVSDLSSQLRVALDQFPGVKLIPFGWVAFFIFLYILMIGPGDYFFLKKVLKRMELTWITFPTIVVTVSLVAYYAAYLLKGNDLLVNKVDVVDVDQQAGLARGHTWISLFSPQNRDYTVRTIPMPLDRDAPPAAPASAGEPARAPAGTEVVTTWFSVPEEQFGGMSSSSRRFSFGGGGYSYQPTGGVELLKDVRIPIWSTKCITARWFGPAAPLVDSDLQPVGTDRLAGTVSNRQSVPLEDAILVYGKQVYLVGTLAPGATVRVALTSDRNMSGHLKDNLPHYLSNQPWNRDLKIDRAELLLAVMFHDSESTLASEHVLANGPLHDLDLTGQLALQRPMLVARINRPGARLDLDNVPSPPKIDQMTLVRIILPLKNP
ncbi:MAG: hypothetical protein ACHRXM_22785 [Isosphaerales bacterium]